ncbi:MAG: O-antigen ligase family protein [Gemmatimonadota bacterium]|nr:O-antigen ligase family protein [Gemmatimonadota bacterium]
MNNALKITWFLFLAVLPVNLTFFLGLERFLPADFLLPVLFAFAAPLVFHRFAGVVRRDWPVFVYLGIFLLVAGLAALRSGIDNSLLIAAAAQGMLAALYLIFRCTVFEKKIFIRLMGLWVGVSSVVCLVGLGAVALGYLGLETPLARWYPEMGPGAWRLIGLTGHSPNMAYGYLHVGFFIALGLWLRQRQGNRDVNSDASPGWWQRTLLPATVLHGLALAATFSRGLPGLLLGMIIVTHVLLPGKSGKRYIGVKISLWAALLVMFAYGTVFFTYTTDALFTSSRAAADSLRLKKSEAHQRFYSYKNVLHLKNGASYRSFERIGFTYLPSMHAYLMQASLHFFIENPLAGVGPGRFPGRLESLRDEGKLGLPPGLPHLRPHSTVMGALAEGGLPGFAGLFLVWWFFLGPRSWRRLRGDRLGLCLYASVAGYLLFALNVDVMNFRWLWLLFAFESSWREMAEDE